MADGLKRLECGRWTTGSSSFAFRVSVLVDMPRTYELSVKVS